MARVYTSRALLDPQLLSLTSQNMANRIQQDRDNRRQVVNAIQTGVGQLGSAIDDWRKRQYEEDLGKERYKYMNRVMQDNPDYEKYKNNPFYKAALHEFARTGASSPLMSFLSSERAAQEHSDTKKWHDAVRAEQARERYAKNLELYDKAETEAQKQQYLLANQALEKEFGNIFGQQMADYGKAREADEIEARRLAYELAEDKKEAEAKARRSDDTKYWIQQNVMPVGSVKPEGYKSKKDGKWKQTKSAEEVRGEIAKFIQRNPDLDDDDKTELLDKLYGNKTQTELNQGAADNAKAGHTGDQTKKKLEDDDNQKAAGDYVGKKLNSLEWKKIPEEVRAFLTRDASGNVSRRE